MKVDFIIFVLFLIKYLVASTHVMKKKKKKYLVASFSDFYFFLVLSDHVAV